MKKLLIFILPCFYVSLVAAQNTKDTALMFTLKQAQEYAVENSYKTVNAEKDITIAQKKVSQTTTIGLPQISASAKYQNYIDIPTQLMPNFLTPAVDGVLLQHGLISPTEILPASDDKFPVQFGSKNNFTADITATQLIFDGTYIVGLQAAKTFVEISKNTYTGSEIEVKETVAQAYYLVLVAEANRSVLDTTLQNLNKVLNDTKKYLDNGFIEETDVDQFQILVSTITNKLNMVDRQIEIAYNLLKYQMGIELTQNIMLKDNLSDLLSGAIAQNLTTKAFDYKNHVDYKSLLTLEKANNLLLKKDKFGYLPSMAAFLTTSRNAQRSTFNFFEKNQDWYKTTILGVGLTIPIFDSGLKHYKIQQDKIEIEKTKLLQTQVQQLLELNVQNNRAKLKTYTDQYQTDLSNMQLAKKIYDKTIIKYKEGISTSLELTQTYNQYLTAQGTYFTTILDLLDAQSNLNKALNNY
jgi:outer membrane protein